MILCIGDSHAMIFDGVEGFKAIDASAHLAYNFGNPKHHMRPVIDKALRIPHDGVLFKFGEIDCRSHIPKHVKNREQLLPVVLEVVKRYKEGLIHFSKSHKVAVYAPHIIQRPSAVYNYKMFQAAGTWEQIFAATVTFNKVLEDELSGTNIGFVTINDWLEEMDYDRTCYIRDGIHLSSLCLPVLLERVRSVL